MGPGDDVRADELAHALGRLGPGVDGRFHGTDVALDDDVQLLYLAILDLLRDVVQGRQVDLAEIKQAFATRRPGYSLPQLLYKPANPYPNTTVSYAVQRDVRCMVVEIGGGYQEQHLHVANGVRGVMNQLRYCGVLPGEVKRRPGQVLMHDLKVLRPRMGGLCVPHQHLVPGQQLPAGTALADIVSPYTFETLETMQAPFDDNIVVLCRNYATRIHPGDYGFMIGNGATSVPYAD